ncbi:MAG: exosortase K [Desulfobulbaceae bacterium]|jgi:exosortase K|nr:exosortase K [Desulfobulbaceae bacterium]
MKKQPAAATTRARILAMVMIIAGVIAIKWCFSDASATRLDWLLRPANELVAFFSGLTFTRLEGLGYYNASQGILIAPACSGLNFFLILLATGWCLAVRCPPPARLGWWFLGIAASAYAFGLVANSCRILVAISLYRWRIAYGLFTPERLHRLEGVIVYYFCLCLFAMLLSALLHRCRGQAADVSSRPRHGWLAAGLYLLFTLGIPLVNGAAARPALFIEHGLTVLALVVGLALVVKVWQNRQQTRQ